MEKSCVNHPESHALATCKACEKSVCLMCVVDEKEGTFCSQECHKVFCEVSDWASPGSSPAPSAEAAPPATAAPPPAPPPEAAPLPEPSPSKVESIFDAEPQPVATAESASYEPLVAPGTKWRMIGAMCTAHTDTPAVATCDRCTRTLCGLCLTELPSGTFCIECASAAPTPEAEEKAIQQAARAPAPPSPAARPRARRSSPAARLAAVAVLLAALGAGTWLYLDLRRREEAAPPLSVQATQDRPAASVVSAPPVSSNPGPKPSPPPPQAVPPPRTEVPAPPPPAPRPETPAPKPPAENVPAPAPNPAARPTPPEPAPAPDPFLLGRIANPWEREPAGSWYRVRRVRNGQTVYTDIGLKSKAPASYVLLTQTRTPEGAEPVREEQVEVSPYLVKGEETLEIEGRKFLCEIQESKEGGAIVRSWVLVEGIHAGAVLKRVGPEGTLVARRVWEHALRIQRRTFDCLVIEAERETPQGTQAVKTWYCAAVPLRKLREETPEESMAVVDLGDDWSLRPPPAR